MYSQPAMQMPTVMNSGPRPVQPVAPGAFTGQQGYNGAAGQGMAPMVQALMRAKMQQRLAGQFPGTTGQANAMLPQTNSMMAGDPTMRALQNPQLSLGG